MFFFHLINKARNRGAMLLLYRAGNKTERRTQNTRAANCRCLYTAIRNPPYMNTIGKYDSFEAKLKQTKP